jgi:hypothetical protein
MLALFETQNAPKTEKGRRACAGSAVPGAIR